MLYYVHKGKTATQAHAETSDVYGVDAASTSTCHNWFKRFRENNFEVATWSERSSKVESNEISAMIASNRPLSTGEIAVHLTNMTL